ncbi:CD209 antigen-like protein C [Macrobrachium rosenbergii]|uniref:CD209 antigen-like protein C n=1 Tax=Macrobrachium rosenbergii TaxID=79674 RepID=UPI0034D6CABE
MECLRMAVAKGFCLLATILLLATAGRCQRVLGGQPRLGRTEDLLIRLTDVVEDHVDASEQVISQLKTLTSSISTDHLVCEGDWVKLGSSCYFLSQYNRNWQESRKECRYKNSELVKITRDDEFIFLKNLVKGQSYYIGLSDQQEEGTFRWVADGTIHSIVRSWWKDTQGNCRNCKRETTRDTEREDCVHYGAENHGFSDVSCTLELRFICEKPALLSWDFA